MPDASSFAAVLSRVGSSPAIIKTGTPREIASETLSIRKASSAPPDKPFTAMGNGFAADIASTNAEAKFLYSLSSRIREVSLDIYRSLF
jgi:hypothetical protein